MLASLWEVSDESTSALMEEFDRFERLGTSVSKTEALRQVQLAVLRGKTGNATGGHVDIRGIRNRREQDSTAPAYQPSANAPCAVPYYWAPFFLIGNWL